MVRLCWGALVRPCSLELKPSRRVTKRICDYALHNSIIDILTLTFKLLELPEFSYNNNYYYHHHHHYYYYIRLMASFPGQPGYAGTRKIKPVWI